MELLVMRRSECIKGKMLWMKLNAVKLSNTANGLTKLSSPALGSSTLIGQNLKEFTMLRMMMPLILQVVELLKIFTMMLRKLACGGLPREQKVFLPQISYWELLKTITCTLKEILEEIILPQTSTFQTLKHWELNGN